jgi:hypothetical protein
MAEVRALKIGLSVQLANGAKVFGVLSDDGACTCFELTAPDGIQTRFALTDDALAAMVDISIELRARPAGVPVAPDQTFGHQPPMPSALSGMVEQITPDNRHPLALEDAAQGDAMDAARFRWYFSDKPKGDWVMTYLGGVRTGWTTDQWRAAIDAALNEQDKP